MDARTLAGFGKDVHTRIRTFFDTPLGLEATPLEIAQAVLDTLERQVQPVGRGRRVFPFSAINVRVLATESTAPGVVAAFRDLEVRVLERLAEVRCEAPQALKVDVAPLTQAPGTWTPEQVFDIEYVAVPPAPPAIADRLATAAAVVTLHVTVLAGTVIDGPAAFTDATVSIGRSADPCDDQGRPRRNRVAFVDDADGINETVGRAHACLKRDRQTGEYRLFDEGSRNGTSIVRDGEVIAVHRRDPRGVRVRSGDEIHLGRAAIRVEITTGDSVDRP